MPTQCCVGGCNKETTKHDVSHHNFPADKRLKTIWIRSIATTRKNWTGPPDSSRKGQVVCSDHFREECFTLTYRTKKSLGLDVKRHTHKLEKDAVPTIFSTNDDGLVNIARSAFRKREVARILKDNADVDTRSAPSSPTPESASPTPDSEPATTVDHPLPVQHVECSDAPPNETQPRPADQQRPHIPKQRKTTYIRSKYVQATTDTKDCGTQFLRRHMVTTCDTGTQYDIKDCGTSPIIFLPKAPSHTRQSMTSTPQKNKPAPLRLPKSPESISAHNTSLHTMPELDDSLYAPSEHSTDESFIATESPKEARKYVVFEDQLLSLFTICRRCKSSTTARISKRKGTFVSVLQECSCGEDYRWYSQPFVGDIPAGNLLLSASILFTGSMPSKVLHVFSHMNLQAHSLNTFFDHQRHFLLPAVETIWQQSTTTLLANARTRGGKVCLAGDGRSDSPGHCAKYGAYTVLDLDAGKVLDIQLVQSNEVKGGSVNMEKEGLIRVVQALNSAEISIDTLVTDRHIQIQKWVRENLPDTRHHYDVWHIAKAVKKKLQAIAKMKDCDDVSSWVKSISNHLYWCAASSQDGEMVVSKWKSVSNHIQNVHEGHEGQFTNCLHDDIGTRQWLKPSTKAACLVEDYVLNTRLCNDVRKLSRDHQTSSLEAFHSVVNHFAPKLFSFSYNPQMCRMKIAALHYNENSNRAHATRKDGQPKTKTSFPKYKKGEYTIRFQTTEPTYRYVDDLMEEVLDGGQETRSQSQLLTTPVPAPLSSTMKRPPKDAVHNRTTRFKKLKLATLQ